MPGNTGLLSCPGGGEASFHSIPRVPYFTWAVKASRGCALHGADWRRRPALQAESVAGEGFSPRSPELLRLNAKRLLSARFTLLFSCAMVDSLIPAVGDSSPPPPAAALSSAMVFPGLRRQAHYEAAAFLRGVRLGGLTVAEVEGVIAVDPEQRARLLEFAAESGKRGARMIERTLELRELTLKEFQRLARGKTLPFPAGHRGRILGQDARVEADRTSLYLLCRRPRANAGPGHPRAAGAVAGCSSQPKATRPKRALPGAESIGRLGSPQPGSSRPKDVSRRRDLPAIELTCAGPSDCFQTWAYQVGLGALSRAIAVHRATVHSWLSGKRTPEPKHARIIIALSIVAPLSHGASHHPLSYQDIYGRVEARPRTVRGEDSLSGL